MPEPLDVETILGTDRWVRRLAREMVSGNSDAEDVSQETWVATLRRASWYKLPRAWMAKVLTNSVRKRYRESCRRERRERLVSRPECDPSFPQDAMERAELRRQLAQAVMELKEPYRSSIVLRFFEDMKLQQIADVQGVSVNTVKTRVCRGLGLMRMDLDRVREGSRAWSIVLFPLLASEAPSAVTRSPAVLEQAGVAWMSTKSVVSASCLSVVVVAALGLALQQVSQEDSKGQPSQPVVAADPGTQLDEHAAEGSPEDPLAPATDDLLSRITPTNPGEVALGSDPDRTEPEPPRDGQAPAVPVSAEVAAMQGAYRALKKAFDEGGGEGWKNVGDNISLTQETLLGSDEGFAELLSLIDEESDGYFLEALMHHLPMAKTESRQAIVGDKELHEAIWSRFEEEGDPQRRMALMRFFAFNRSLNSTRMDAFLEVARNDPAKVVRQLSIDAISSNREFIDETWETLADVVENDPSSACRQTAIYGLALIREERATSLVNAAFSSPDEAMRTAALLSKAGDEPPLALTAGDTISYLVNEFRTASSRRYKSALVKRLLERSPQILEGELRRVLPTESDWRLKKDYKAALKQISGT